MQHKQDKYRETLEAAKRGSVGQLLMKAGRLLNEQAIVRVRAKTGETRLRPSHTQIFPHVELEGTRLTAIAERLGVTKQAAGQLVEELEEMGILERAADPTDGRAKLIRFSAAGRKGLLQGLAVLGEIEGELAARVGARRMAVLHEALLEIVDGLSEVGDREQAR